MIDKIRYVLYITIEQGNISQLHLENISKLIYNIISISFFVFGASLFNFNTK